MAEPRRSFRFVAVLALFAGAGLALEAREQTQEASDSQPVQRAKEAPFEIRGSEILRHAVHLSTDAMEGRHAGSEAGMRAAAYIAGELERIGLEPLGEDESFFLPIDDPKLSPNVAGILPGEGEGVYLLVAHYDHLEPRSTGEDRIFNGADDNASGTAVLIVVAEALAARGEGLEASLGFVAFTAEEMGLRGSRHFVAEPPFPLTDVRGVINLDMVGRGEADLIFTEGGPKAPELMAAVTRANEVVGLRIRSDEHPEWIPASDHYPFMKAGIPALYFGVEDHPDYHRVSDHADKLIPELMERVAKLAHATLLDVGGA